jgi:hypothetical protein
VTNTLKDELTSTPDGLACYQLEYTSVTIGNELCLILEVDGVSREELGKRLGKSKRFVDNLLDNPARYTFEIVSKAFTVLGYEWIIGRSKKIEKESA